MVKLWLKCFAYGDMYRALELEEAHIDHRVVTKEWAFVLTEDLKAGDAPAEV
jgi:hypothetical protein